MESIIQFKKKLISEGKKGLALDIDETLSFTIALLIEKLIENFGNPEDLSVLELIKKYKYTQNIPYWQHEEANKIIEQCINSNEVQIELPLIENANKVVQQINKIVPIVAYITVRPETVTRGTKVWLDKHNFPKAEIIARPIDIAKANGNKWKAEVLEYLYPEVIGIVDDNPGLVGKLSPNYKGTVYLYNTAECQDKHIDVVPCAAWTDVANAILNRKR